MQMFSPRPKFDLAAFLSEKASPAQLKKQKQSRSRKAKPAVPRDTEVLADPGPDPADLP